MTIYFLRFFRFYTSQKIDSLKSLRGVTGNILKIKNTMKNMHDTSHKKLSSYYGFHQKFYNREFLLKNIKNRNF
jgi:hypothetical protein